MDIYIYIYIYICIVVYIVYMNEDTVFVLKQCPIGVPQNGRRFRNTVCFFAPQVWVTESLFGLSVITLYHIWIVLCHESTQLRSLLLKTIPFIGKSYPAEGCQIFPCWNLLENIHHVGTETCCARNILWSIFWCSGLTLAGLVSL